MLANVLLERSTRLLSLPVDLLTEPALKLQNTLCQIDLTSGTPSTRKLLAMYTLENTLFCSVSALKSVWAHISVYKYICMCFLSISVSNCRRDGVRPHALYTLCLSQQASIKIRMLLLKSTNWSTSQTSSL